jgi:hypothetical protein
MRMKMGIRTTSDSDSLIAGIEAAKSDVLRQGRKRRASDVRICANLDAPNLDAPHKHESPKVQQLDI